MGLQNLYRSCEKTTFFLYFVPTSSLQVSSWTLWSFRFLSQWWQRSCW